MGFTLHRCCRGTHQSQVSLCSRIFIAFLSVDSSSSWCFACLDSVTHMAEEIPRPDRNIPKALLSTVALGFFTAFPYCIGMFFGISDLDAVTGSDTGVPIFEIYR